jgi:hypothetical protein
VPNKPEATLRLEGGKTIDNIVPSAITAIRLGLVPLLAFLVSNGMLVYGAALFLFLLFTDFFRRVRGAQTQSFFKVWNLS